jgi:dipeptidyl aminopeptidase/acylaminoacyl peptidase
VVQKEKNMASQKRFITAEDLYNFELVSSVEISPNGQHVVYALQRVDQASEKKFSNLWIIPTDGGEARQFTYGDQVDGSPKWSPDGSQIAFLSNRKDEKQPQIYLIPFKGGEARPLTQVEGSFKRFEWSPDGEKFVCQFRKKDEEDVEREKDENKKKLGVVQRHVKRISFKFDGAGFLPKERWHIWVIDTKTGVAQQLTDGSIYDEASPAWSPDGAQILFTSNRSPDPDLDYDVADLYTIPAEGGEIRKIETPEGPKQFPRFSPDGKWIAYYGSEGLKIWWKNTSLWVLPADGSALAQNLTGPFDFNVAPEVMNDTNGGAAALVPPVWSGDSQSIFFPVGKHGSSTIQSISVNGENLRSVVEGIGAVGMFGLDQTQTQLVYFYSRMTDPGQIYLKNLESGNSHQLTDLNNWFKEVDLGEVEEVWFQGRDANDLQGWILKPPGFDPAQKYPSILEIHGGPMGQYGYFFMHEFYYLAAQGYVVYFSNPRGGQGYGEEHTRAIFGNWGDADYADLMSWVDLVKAQPYIDPARMGVTGGSYGGYMTLWVIGHTHQFKAAVAQRVVSNFTSMWGSSDMNWQFSALVGDPAPVDDIETAWNHSPVKYLKDATTPTLIIHSEDDNRCPIEQGEQAFVTLKVKAGVDTEMVRFPGEPHGLSRVGRTDRRIARLNHILRWMDKYLK